MATYGQITANTSNAQHSTGPRTPEGKAHSAQNARTHGLTSRDVVINVGEHAEFEQFQADLRADLRPVGALENEVFDQLLHAAWNMRRSRRLESALPTSSLDPLLDEEHCKTAERLARYYNQFSRHFYRALKELKALQTHRGVREALPEPETNGVPPLADMGKRIEANAHAIAAGIMARSMDREAGLYGAAQETKRTQSEDSALALRL